MKQYPTIQRKIQYGLPVYVFDKIDGSNIRIEWSRKKNKFYKYGSRKELISTSHLFLGDSIKLIQEKYEEQLIKRFEKQRWTRCLAFFEYYGFSSFAGYHELEESHDLVLIDVKPYKHGILNPDEFIDLFGDLGIPNLIHRGNINKEIEEQIRTQKINGITFEGVVCKAKVTKKTANPVMFKIKTYAWLQKLKNFCKGNELLFQQLL